MKACVSFFKERTDRVVVTELARLNDVHDTRSCSPLDYSAGWAAANSVPRSFECAGRLQSVARCPKTLRTVRNGSVECVS